MAEYRIECPSTENKSIDERAVHLLNNIKRWICSPAMQKLVERFGGSIDDSASLMNIVNDLNSFVNIWDFRKLQAGGGERWNITDTEKVLENKDLIFECATELGLVNQTEPVFNPDYILPLGGARMSNLFRPGQAKKTLESHQDCSAAVVALSGKRPINEIETEFINQYAPDASTEYDAICSGLEKSFGLEHEYHETDFVTPNLNMQWAKREYSELYRDSRIFSIAAPSSDPKRRANSFDTFEFFMEQFDVKEGSKVLLVTSAIYVPFQLLKFMPIALKENIMVDCIGVDSTQAGTQFNQPVNYLQELKGAVNAVKTLCDEYSELAGNI